jgi:hypothetical protein
MRSDVHEGFFGIRLRAPSGRPATIRNPSTSGTGSRAESPISHGVRRGADRVGRVRTVLVREARRAETKVATAETRKTSPRADEGV